jgi:hypothetical protein
VGDVSLAVVVERLEAVGMLLGVTFDRGSGTAVGVPFAQDRVDGRTETGGVARLDLFLRVGLGIFGIVGKLVSLRLQLGDTLFELGDGGGDVGSLMMLASGFCTSSPSFASSSSMR